ncbi:MAG TPA: hypothetical protein VK879_07125 [Candidatus Sulfomarinibacteraceae bacterium]|nr:hypothetical protein [Candidatus Sulfomarinibacteraceae bacterium]
MPPLSIWFVRSALIHLFLGFSVGALMLGNKGVPFEPGLWRLREAHIELLLIGWLVQLALGVSFWILPRFWESPVRGNVTGAYVSFALLNAGVWCVVLGTSLDLSSRWLLLGRLSEVGAAVAYAVHLWPRIVSREGVG